MTPINGTCPKCGGYAYMEWFGDDVVDYCDKDGVIQR